MTRLRIKGDFGKLSSWSTRLDDLKDDLSKLNRLLAEDTIDLIREGFENSRDPYGIRWARLKLRQGRPLEDTGGLKGSWNYTHSSRGFNVGSGKHYAVYHQRGTGLYGPRKAKIKPVRAKALRLKNGMFRRSVKGSPKRKMVPDGDLPPAWTSAYQETVNEFFKARLTKRKS